MLLHHVTTTTTTSPCGGSKKKKVMPGPAGVLAEKRRISNASTISIVEKDRGALVVLVVPVGSLLILILIEWAIEWATGARLTELWVYQAGTSRAGSIVLL
jgi:hypothetical protein